MWSVRGIPRVNFSFVEHSVYSDLPFSGGRNEQSCVLYLINHAWFARWSNMGTLKMDKLITFILISTCLGRIVSLAQAPPIAEKYERGLDSLLQPGVPKGELLRFELVSSRAFPGTKREIAVYVPAEYRAEGPACVYIGLDGLEFEVPTVFDNLIFKQEMPLTIAIGIEPGSVESEPAAQNPRFEIRFPGFNVMNWLT